MATVDILLATFNAGSFLQEQIDSLLAQTFTDWRLLVRDDCSHDDTPRVVGQYTARYPERIVAVTGPARNEGSCRNFSALMECATAPYTMFCDQDDFWLPEKIERSLDCLRGLEAIHGDDMPLLVHTDLRVVDETLQALADSFWSLHSLDPQPARPLNRLCVQNFVTGCASIFNRCLRETAAPLPTAALVHDWWLALVAAGLGRIDCLTEATLLYRQHERNQIGVPGQSARAGQPGWRHGAIRSRRPLLPGLRWVREEMRRKEGQVGALLERYGERLSPRARREAEIFSRLSHSNFVQRRYQLLVHRFSSHGFLRNLGTWLGI